ncbi:MAG: hypothetical protein FJW31_21970 [Acidobacteria bacterium]|nr:hypothetical protein [Acidobacteriota bacterium]
MLRSLLTLLPFLAAAQDAHLRRAFEGKTVRVKIDMPGDDGGINVYPQREDRVDWRRVGDAIKRYGAALRKGDEATVTKVHIKPKLIEFQLNGGGFGSWSDTAGRPSVPNTYVSKSSRERDLEKQRNNASGDRRRDLDREIDYLRRDREREETRLRAIGGRVEVEAQEWERERRLRSGSRFNLHYPKGVSPEAASPEAIIAAVAEFVDFGEGATAGNDRRQPALRTRGDGAAALKKGLTEAEVTDLLGEPRTRKTTQAAGLPIVEASYESADSVIQTQFANGVLARFTISSK